MVDARMDGDRGIERGRKILLEAEEMGGLEACHAVISQTWSLATGGITACVDGLLTRLDGEVMGEFVRKVGHGVVPLHRFEETLSIPRREQGYIVPGSRADRGQAIRFLLRGVWWLAWPSAMLEAHTGRRRMWCRTVCRCSCRAKYFSAEGRGIWLPVPGV